MSTSRAVATNTAVNGIGKIVSIAIGVAVIAMMTRHLGTEGFGHYSTIVAFLQIFGILVDFGLTLAHTQLLSTPGVHKERVVGAILGLRIVSALIFLVIAPVSVLFFPYPAVVKWGVAIFTVNFLFISVSQILIGVFQYTLTMGLATIAEIASRVVLLVSVFWVVQMDGGLLTMLGAIILATAVHVAVMLVFANRLIRIRPHIDLTLWKQILRTAWPVGLGIFFTLLYLKGDTIILSLYRDATEVGLYGAPFRVLEVLIALPYIFTGIVFPLFRTAWVEDKARFRRMIARSFDAVAIVTAPLVAGFLVLGDPIMVFVAGEEFASSGVLVKILIIATGCIFVSTLFAHAIVAMDKQRAMLWGYGATALLALIGYFLFIPHFGAVGAAWMTVVAEGMIAVILVIATITIAKLRLSWMVFAKSSLASAVMAMVLMFFPPAHVLVLSAVGAITYAAAILLVRGLPSDVISMVTKR